MTIREIVNILQSQGHSISYYVRKDGGILIKEIDGQRFSGAMGNLYARAMTGQRLSVKRAEQLHKITYTGKRAKKYIEDREIKRLLQRVQRKWNKAFPHKRGEAPLQGLKTAKGVKWTIEHKGRAEAIRLLKEAERYASGKAYTENIQQLIYYVRDVARKLDSDLLHELADDIESNAWKIMENRIYPAYHELYQLEHGIPVEEVVRNVRRVLEL